VPHVQLTIRSGHADTSLLRALSKGSAILAADSTWKAGDLRALVMLLVTSAEPVVVGESPIILCNLLKSPVFVGILTGGGFIEFYVIGTSRPPPLCDVIFDFLRSSLALVVPDRSLLDVMAENLRLPFPSHLWLCAAMYKRLQAPPPFESFNIQVQLLENCTCYEDLFACQGARAAFEELCRNPAPPLGAALLEFSATHEEAESFIRPLIRHASRLPPDRQETLLLGLRSAKNFLSELIPPWKGGFDGAVLARFLANVLDSSGAAWAMRETFNQCAIKELANALTNHPHFADVVEQMFAQTREQDVLISSASVLFMLDRVDGVALVLKLRKFLPDEFFRPALMAIIPNIMKFPAVVPQLCEYPDVCDALRNTAVVGEYVMQGNVDCLVAPAKGAV
jgi:hypothetical protein